MAEQISGGVQSAVSAFAAALRATPEYQAYQEARERLRLDDEAQSAIEAYRGRSQALHARLLLNAVSYAERTELERLRERAQEQPKLIAVQNAEAGLKALCRGTGNALSGFLGLDYASCCASGCCS